MRTRQFRYMATRDTSVADPMCGWRQAGAYYGQFCGQYTARRLASPGVAQSDPDSQLLLGVNDASAAATMHLRGEEWAGPDSSSAFLLWIRNHVLLGHPVIIGGPPTNLNDHDFVMNL